MEKQPNGDSQPSGGSSAPWPEKSGDGEQPHSGHSIFRKVRFATTLTAVFLAMTASSAAKDVYVEKLGGDPIVMGIVFFAVSFVSPINEIISGRLQNKNVLRRCFPIEKWGRKAPWLFSHTIMLALATGALYLPPSRDVFVVHAWFFVVSVWVLWSISTCLIAFESCRQELYPYNEERTGVEFFCKITVAVGIVLAALPLLVLLANSALWLRIAASLMFAVSILASGLQAKPIWMEASSTSKEDEAPHICDDIKVTWGNRAFRHLVGVRFWEGAYQGLQATNMWYYLTYILQLHGVQRSLGVVFVGASAMLGDFTVAAYVGRAMAQRKNSYRIQGAVAICRICNAALTVALMVLVVFLGGAGPYPEDSRGLLIERVVFIVWVTVNRALQSPFTFWRVGAQCWVIDEDIHLDPETKKEAAFISVASASQNFSRAFSAALAFLGYGLCGLAPKDCEHICAQADLSIDALCLEDCMQESIVSQPSNFRWYIRLLNIVGLTVCELFLLYHVIAFPIKGIRLARLYNNQTAAYGGSVDAGSADKQMKKLEGKMSPGLKEIAEAQHGTSVVVMGDDPDAGKAHVRQLMSRGKSKGLSTSVIFSPAMLSMGSPSRGFPPHSEAEPWEVPAEAEIPSSKMRPEGPQPCQLHARYLGNS